MWNEEDFFKDYVQSAEKIKPDSDFLEQLKTSTNIDNVKKLQNKKKIITFLAAAASFALCISLVGYGLGIWGQDTSLQPSESLSANKEKHDATGNVAGDNSELSKVLTMLADNNTMLDNIYGESVSDSERNWLISLLNSCVKTDAPKDTALQKTVYYCVGNDTIKITVYEEQFIEVNDIMYEIKK
ncbi:MAG: hypothetical protein HFJ09_10640 [Lachnospiraceae bacterium]|nr:hypothetical protein [Lachnospiraceae bacterium]